MKGRKERVRVGAYGETDTRVMSFFCYRPRVSSCQTGILVQNHVATGNTRHAHGMHTAEADGGGGLSVIKKRLRGSLENEKEESGLYAPFTNCLIRIQIGMI